MKQVWGSTPGPCRGERGCRGRCHLILQILISPSSQPPSLLTFKTPRPCVYCPTPSSSSWLASSRTETLRGEGASLASPQASPGLAGAPTPPPGSLLPELSFVSHLVCCSSPGSFSSFQSSAQACLRLLARTIACQGSAQGTKGWDSPQSCFRGPGWITQRGLKGLEGSPWGHRGAMFRRAILTVPLWGGEKGQVRFPRASFLRLSHL